MILKKRIILIISILLLSFIGINHSNSIEPDVFVQSTVNRAAKTLSGNFTKEERVERLKDIARETVDIRGIGFYSLGKYRKNISDSKKEEYLEIFTKYFLKTFASRLAQYSDPKILVNSQKKLNDKYTMVYSTLIATEDKPEVKINWRVVTKDPESPLIIDLIIELSLIHI